ncbi:TPA: hypothetical protein ACGB9K_000995, partial [Pseudomonas aeruginosa]
VLILFLQFNSLLLVTIYRFFEFRILLNPANGKDLHGATRNTASFIGSSRRKAAGCGRQKPARSSQFIS